MEKIEFFEIKELEYFYKNEEIFLSLDVLDLTNGITKNIIENKSVKVSKFPNTLEEIGKKYYCENKIIKYINGEYEFTLTTFFEKKGVFQYSISIKT